MIRESLLPEGAGSTMSVPRCFPETDGSSVPAPFASAGGAGRFAARAKNVDDADLMPPFQTQNDGMTVDAYGHGGFFTPASIGPWVDIYLSAGVEDGGASCHHDNQATCGLYRVRWDLGLERAVEVELIRRSWRGPDGTQYGNVEAAVSEAGDLAWLLRGYDPSGGDEKQTYLLHRRSGSSFADVLDSGTAKADRPHFPWFNTADTVIYAKHDGGPSPAGPDWQSLWWVPVGGAPHALVGRGPETELNSGASDDLSYGNPQAFGYDGRRVVTFGVEVGADGTVSEHTVPHVTSFFGTGREDFSLGGGGFLSCQHPAWSLDGTRIACTRHAKMEERAIDRKLRQLYRFAKVGTIWVSEGPLFKAADPSLLPGPFPGVSCKLLTYKQAHWCGDATHVVATVFCTDSNFPDLPPSMSRVLLINFKDQANPVHYDVTAAVVAAFREMGGNRRWRAIFSVCRTVG